MNDGLPARFPALDSDEVQLILNRYRETHRLWHSLRHITDLLDLIDFEPGLSESDREMLGYVALFHDAVYAPLRSDNEEESAKLAMQYLGNYPRRDEVVAAILATKTHQSEKPLEQKFNAWDCAILRETSWKKLVAYEECIAFEYGEVERGTYRRERSRFLRKAAQDYANPSLMRLADEVENGRGTD